MRSSLIALAFAFGLTGAAGCKNQQPKADPGPACPEVVDHMLEVMKQGLTGHDGQQLANRQQMIDQCETRKLSADERRCLRAAKTLADLASCRKPASPPAGTGNAGSGNAGSGNAGSGDAGSGSAG